MAPALTEPISPTEKLDSSATTATATRATRKTEQGGIKPNNNNIIKKSPHLREKRNLKSSITTVQKATTSVRATRSKETQQQKNTIKQSPKSNLKNSNREQEFVKSESSNKESNSDCTNNEQMGLSTAILETQNQIIDKNTTTSDLVKEESTVDRAAKEDTSTAQLLADLTNEAITADICLRNQLKDVNLVKASEGSRSPLQRDSDIVVLKAIAASPSTAVDTAHMETQCNETETNTKSKQDSTENLTQLETANSTEAQEDKTIPKDQKSESEQKEKLSTYDDVVEEDKNAIQTEETSSTSKHANVEETCTQESPIGSPDFQTEVKTDARDSSKAEILCVQELPPVNTDSTMTASEVEDNLEERLSQLDGTAIDSPPPNNDDVDKDALMKIVHNVESTTTPPRTPIHQHSLSEDVQHIQQQLQNTPPTPVSQQVQAHHVQQQQNCFTPQSTVSSVNTIGSGNIPQSFIKESEGAELEDQDIEEVFKVLKGFEGGTTSDLNVCDLNVLFNEVYMKMNETEINGNASATAGAVSASQSLSQGGTTNNPSIQLVKPTELEEGQQDIEKRQQQLQRKVDFLMRRLRKLQSRYMCKHTSEEIAGLFEWSTRQVSKGVTNNVTSSSSTEKSNPDPSKYFLKVIAARPPATDWKNEQEELVPATQITTLLRKIEGVATAQQHCTTPVTNSQHYAATSKKTKKSLLEAHHASGSKNGVSISSIGRAENIVVSTFDENVTDELTQVAGLLQSEMCEVQRAIDSDATESSSGGESADEMVTYNNQQQQTLPIAKRAAWRYSRDRAAIASRWSWLLSQISDLEIKIRQHSDLYQEIVKSKGPVTCMEADSKQIKLHDDNAESSCRTRGYMPTLFRKRKLIQTTNMHTISKKAARPSTIKCGCQWPLHPCALCTGRTDPTAPRDLPDTMMMSDRIALLDPGYHPVLSFRENVNNALHFEAIAKQPDWQQRVIRCQAKNIAKSLWKAEREAVAAAGGHTSKKYGDTPVKRRYVKKKDRDDKSGTVSSNILTQARSTMPTTDGAAAASNQIASSASSSLNDATLATTSTTTPLVANMGKSGKKQQCQILSDVILKEPIIPTPPRVSSTNVVASTAMSSATMMTSTHQTSDYLPTNYDQYNLNPTHLSSISNSSSNNSKSNKHRKLSSASIAATSHHYNQHHNNNHLYNGESNFLHNHEWSTTVTGGGVIEGIAVRSRTSSPTHGFSYQNKIERSFDRKTRVSYDIDNIVIPYSVAAATRVEILPYKEIPTPKWRVINVNAEESESTEMLEIDKMDGTNGNASDSEKQNSQDTIKRVKNSLETEGEKRLDLNSTIDHTTGKISAIEAKETEENSLPSHVQGVCVENGLNKLNGSKCEEDDDATNEPDVKKIRIEPNVIKIQLNEEQKSSTNNLCEELIEDISDDAMILRHEKALTEERRKFQTYLKFPWSTRSRANRRIDSRAESSGANTPDPSSPAPQTPSVGGGDQESIPSPSNPSTPLNILDTVSEAGDNSTSFLGVAFLSNHNSSKRQERRRTTSTKRDLERRSSTPDSKEIIPPYEPMKFPLTDEQFEELMSAMPSEHGEESRRFDDCYLPGNGGSGIKTRNYYATGNASKRSSRSSTVCGERRIKGSLKNNSVDDVNTMMSLDNGTDDILFDEEYDDYPKHHLAPNDHMTADDCADHSGDQIDMYADEYNNFSSKRRKQKHLSDESDGDSTETEPFQDDDPNDPEWKGEGEDRSRKKI